VSRLKNFRGFVIIDDDENIMEKMFSRLRDSRPADAMTEAIRSRLTRRPNPTNSENQTATIDHVGYDLLSRSDIDATIK